MYFLTGLLGMMVLGSVAVFSTGSSEDDALEPEADLGPDLDNEGAAQAAPTDTAITMDGSGTSLFAQMGLINAMGLTDDGGDSDDQLAGINDTDLPGDGATDEEVDVAFDTGDWIETDPATLTEYDASEDQLVIIYDDSTDHDPELEIRVSAEDPDTSEVVVDGQVITTLPTLNAPPLDAIALIGESSAQDLIPA